MLERRKKEEEKEEEKKKRRKEEKKKRREVEKRRREEEEAAWVTCTHMYIHTYLCNMVFHNHNNRMWVYCQREREEAASR